MLMRIYSGKLKKEKFGKFNFVSLPFYLAPKILELASEG
jgi:hypothetical protein